MGLFDSVNLGEESFIEIPDLEAPEIEIEEKDITEPVKKPTGKEKEADLDDGLIEVPDVELEEEVEDENERDRSENPSSKTKGSSSSSPYKPFAKALVEEGFLSEFADEDFDNLSKELGGDVAALIELSRRSLQEELEAYKNEQEEDFKAFIQAKEQGLDLNKWYDINQNKKVYNSITEDKVEADEKLQKSLVASYLKEKGFSQEEIDDTIETYEDTSKLELRAKIALKKLKEIEEVKEAKLIEDKKNEDARRAKEREDSIKTLKTKIDEYKEIVPGIQINKQTKDKLFKNIIEPVKTGPNGESWNLATAKRMEDPFKYAIIENYLIELGVFDGKFDKIISKQKTKAITELERTLSANKNTAFIGKASDNSSDDDIDFRLPKF